MYFYGFKDGCIVIAIDEVDEDAPLEYEAYEIHSITGEIVFDSDIMESIDVGIESAVPPEIIGAPEGILYDALRYEFQNGSGDTFKKDARECIRKTIDATEEDMESINVNINCIQK